MPWRSRSTDRGELVAEVLAGAWRATAQPLQMRAADLGSVLPCLSETGAASLAWGRVRHSTARASPAASALRQAYRMGALNAALYKTDLSALLRLLRTAG